MLAVGLVFALPTWAQQKPFTQEQVSNMVRDGFGDESGAKLIEQRGIDFAPAVDFMQSLKAAGASEPFLQALRGAKHPPQPGEAAKKPLDQVSVILLLAGQVPSHRVATLIREHGIDFDVKDDYLREVRLGGGDEELISALKSAKVTMPVTVDSASEARQAEVRQHVVRGAELGQKGEYAEAAQEYRAALLFDPQNADLYASLAYILYQQKKWDDVVAAAREALRLNPSIANAHSVLASALANKGDWDGAIPEYREAMRLSPDNGGLHFALGDALYNKGDPDGAIAEYREMLRWNPKFYVAHYFLGIALGKKGDPDGAIAEYREMLRLDPNNDLNQMVHFYLGVAFLEKRDLDGAIAEYREALRLDPKDDQAHSGLGLALEGKGDLHGAFEEYRTAYMLNPKNATNKQDYERLLQQVNP
jgi:tetratricopeptide (TPR) repeat protein